MSDTTSTPASWSGPGIIQSFATLPPTSRLSPEILTKWFDEIYVPASIETGVVISASRFKAADPEYGKQYMIVSKVPDLGAVQAGKLASIPRTSDLFPTNEPVDAFIEVETRVLSLVQLYETTKQPEDAATTMIYAAMEPQPGGEADLDAWYRDEHNQQMSEQPGWKRTIRYHLLAQLRGDSKHQDAPSFLAIHEFGEGHRIGKAVEPLDPMTDWTKRCMSEAKAIDAAVYHKEKSFGRATGDS